MHVFPTLAGSVELFSQDEAPLDPVDNRRRSSRLAVVGSQSAELLHNNSMELEESQLEGGRPRESGKSLLVEPVPPEVERLSLLRQDLPSTLGSGREDDLFNYDPMSSNDNGIPQVFITMGSAHAYATCSFDLIGVNEGVIQSSHTVCDLGIVIYPVDSFSTRSDQFEDH